MNPVVSPVGVLDSSAVPGVWADIRSRLERGATVRVDLGGVTAVDSSALAMVVDLAAEAAARGATVSLSNVPSKLTALARLSDLDDLLARLSG